MMRLAGAALVSVLAFATAAQEVPFSIEATEACLAGASDRAGREACVGASAEACMDTPDGSTTVGMGFCLGAERDWWGVRLNGAYQSLLAIEDAAAAELKELGSAAPSPAAALRAMERAWIAWRDAACEYEVSTWGGGTGGGPAGADCMMRLTARQALALEDRLKVAGGP
jgi:uncharacterized protein YecT (DUF1311 family)